MKLLLVAYFWTNKSLVENSYLKSLDVKFQVDMGKKETKVNLFVFDQPH